MSQKKARLNRARSLTKEIMSTPITSEISKTIMAHLLWSVPADEMRAHFTGAGPHATIRLVDASDSGHARELIIKVASQDALSLISAEVDDDLVQAVADDYHEFLDPLFPEGLVATVSLVMEDGSGPHIVLKVTPEDYVTGTVAE